jgi:hypothetical protein
MWTVHALIVLIAGGLVACIVLDREVWPLSNYPMYSELYRGSFIRIRLFGVVDGNEVPLTRYRYWVPLWSTRMAKALKAFDGMREDPTRSARVLEGLAHRYEERRTRGLHDGPPISALRAYELTWTIRSGAVNRSEPDSRRLIGEHIFDVAR